MSFRFDIAVLCELIQGRPCIWDKKDKNYKNKIIREKAWEEIFQFLDDGYEGRTIAEKKETGNNDLKNTFLK